eukprot:7484583-Pyramimonas_sp.AAC.1
MAGADAAAFDRKAAAFHLKEGWRACGDMEFPQKLFVLSALIGPQKTYMHRVLDKTSSDAQETQFVR